MQATMNAPRVGFPSYPAQAPGRPVPEAPQKAAPTPEQLQLAAQKLVNAYANAVVDGLYKIIAAEADKCEKEQIKQNVINITLGSEKNILKKAIRPMALHAAFASGQIDSELSKLNSKETALFHALTNVAISLMSKQCENTLKVVQACSTNSFHANTLEKTHVNQSSILKTQVFVALNRIPENQKQIIYQNL